jgi:hypothetical protein
MQNSSSLRLPVKVLQCATTLPFTHPFLKHPGRSLRSAFPFGRDSRSVVLGGVLNGQVGMTAVGTRIDELGTLMRDGGAFYLRRDMGGRYQLELHRTPVDLVEKRVRLVGTLVGPDLVNADGVAPA